MTVINCYPPLAFHTLSLRLTDAVRAKYLITPTAQHNGHPYNIFAKVLRRFQQEFTILGKMYMYMKATSLTF